MTEQTEQKSKTFMCPKCGRTLTVSAKNTDKFACGECKEPMKQLGAKKHE